MSKQYSFVTRWEIKAPLQEVWQAIYESEQWPQWWKDVKQVREIIKGDENGIGSVRVYTISSPMSYTLNFSLLLTERIDLKLLRGTASGQLEGTGAWHFSENNGVSCVVCHWQVTTTVKWMNSVAFLLAPLFRYNHTIVMKSGARSLARKLNAPLVRC